MPLSPRGRIPSNLVSNASFAVDASLLPVMALALPGLGTGLSEQGCSWSGDWGEGLT